MKLIIKKRFLVYEVSFFVIFFLLINLSTEYIYTRDITVTSSDNAGAGTLRTAISEINSLGNSLSNSIAFASTITSINLESNLPAIEKPVNMNLNGSNITLDGTAITTTNPGDAIGLRFLAEARGSQVQNFTLQNFRGSDSTNPVNPGNDGIALLVERAEIVKVQDLTFRNIRGGNGAPGTATLAGSDGGLAVGIRATASLNSIFRRNVFLDNITGGDAGIAAVNGISGNAGKAVNLLLEDSVNSTVQDNTFNNSTNGGNGDTSNNGSNSLAGNSVIISLFNSRDNTLSGNKISSTNAGGNSSEDTIGADAVTILLDQSDDNTLDSNEMTGTNIGGNGQDGGKAVFLSLTDSVNNRLINNIISGRNVGGNGTDMGGDSTAILFMTSDNNLTQNNFIFKSYVDNSQGGLGSSGSNGDIYGILVTDNSSNNAILNNSIFGNLLKPGITLRNNGNNDQESPVISSVNICNTLGSSGSFVASGSLNDTSSNSRYIIQFFSNSQNQNPNQGRTFIGETTITGNGDTVNFNNTVIPISTSALSTLSAIGLDSYFTATATLIRDINSSTPGDTSEFSEPVKTVNNIQQCNSLVKSAISVAIKEKYCNNIN